MKSITRLLFVLVFLALPIISFAHGHNWGGGGGYSGGGSTGGGGAAAPIDGGLSFLIVAGVGAGIKKMMGKKDEENEK